MKKNRKLEAVILFMILSCFGFLIKLPNTFHHYDKELHAVFYFSAFIFLSIFLTKRVLQLVIILITFGLFIEYAQEYSNKISKYLIGKPIHGRFDKEDIKFNLIGIGLGLIFQSIINLIRYILNEKTE